MRKTWIIILLCSFAFMAQAMDYSNMQRFLKNKLTKLDMIVTKIKKSVSFEDFIGLQGLYTQRLVDYFIDNLPDGKGNEIIEEFEKEKRLVEEFAAIAQETKSVVFSNHYYELRKSDGMYKPKEESDYDEDDIHSNG